MNIISIDRLPCNRGSNTIYGLGRPFRRARSDGSMGILAVQWISEPNHFCWASCFSVRVHNSDHMIVFAVSVDDS